MPDHVFISYAHRPEDNAYVERLSAFLKKNGVPNWFDAEIVPGDQWKLLIQDKIESCSALIVIMTPEGARSEWVGQEVQEAKTLGKPIIPLLRRGRPFIELNTRQYEDVSGGDLPRAEFLVRLKRMLPSTPVPRPAPAAPPLRRGRGLTVGDPGRAYSQVRPKFVADGTAPADTAIDGGSFGDLEIRGASVRGLIHRYSGTPRQDAFAIGTDRSRRWLVVAVADGQSSALLSHLSAQLVVGRATAFVSELLDFKQPDELDWNDVFKHLAESVLALGFRHLEEADARAIDRSMATTALVAAYEVAPVAARRRLVVAKVGDSGAWRLSTSGRWQTVSPIVDPGFEASNLAIALPRLPDKVPVQHLDLPASDTVALLSDGVGDPLGTGSGEVGAFLSHAWREPPDLLEFAAQVGFGRKSYDDDRTAVVIWPQPPQG